MRQCQATADETIVGERFHSFATSPSPATFRSVVGQSHQPSTIDCAIPALPSETVAQTLGRRINITAGDDRSQSPDVGFLEIHPVEKSGFVMCSVSIFHLMICLYLCLSVNGDDTLWRPIAITKQFDQILEAINHATGVEAQIDFQFGLGR